MISVLGDTLFRLLLPFAFLYYSYTAHGASYGGYGALHLKNLVVERKNKRVIGMRIIIRLVKDFSLVFLGFIFTGICIFVWQVRYDDGYKKGVEVTNQQNIATSIETPLIIFNRIALLQNQLEHEIQEICGLRSVVQMDKTESAQKMLLVNHIELLEKYYQTLQQSHREVAKKGQEKYGITSSVLKAFPENITCKTS